MTNPQVWYVRYFNSKKVEKKTYNNKKLNEYIYIGVLIVKLNNSLTWQQRTHNIWFVTSYLS